MMIPIQSQIIQAVSYDATALSLFVQLQSGKGYVYEGVSRERAQGLIDSDSPGRYFNTEIRSHYEGRQVDGVFG